MCSQCSVPQASGPRRACMHDCACMLQRRFWKLHYVCMSLSMVQ